MQNKFKAFSVIELMLSAALFSIFSVAITVAILQGSSVIQDGVQSEMARQFAMEGIEAVRAIRAQSFDALQNTAGSGLRVNNGKWEFSGAQDERDGYARVVSVQSAQRDSDGNITASGGTDDVDLKLVAVNITKNKFSTNLSAYLSRREIIPIAP